MKHLDIAFNEYGEKEIVGPLHNQEVLEYYEVAGHSWVKDDETAWCAAFVGFCLEKSGIRSTRALNARSYLNFGAPTANPSVGDIVVFWRGSKDGWQGHVGFFIRKDGDKIYVLGGNQSNEVNISPYSASQLLGYRKVPGVDTLKSIDCSDHVAQIEKLEKENTTLKKNQQSLIQYIIHLINRK